MYVCMYVYVWLDQTCYGVSNNGIYHINRSDKQDGFSPNKLKKAILIIEVETNNAQSNF